MILDSLDHFSRYLPLHPDLIEIHEFLQKGVLEDPEAAIREGHFDLNRMIVENNDIGKRTEEAKLEAHDLFIDLQICLEGPETYGWADRRQLVKPEAPFDAKRDVGFWLDDPTFYFTLKTGFFAIFWPDDAHAPGISDGSFRKLLFKFPVLPE